MENILCDLTSERSLIKRIRTKNSHDYLAFDINFNFNYHLVLQQNFNTSPSPEKSEKRKQSFGNDLGITGPS